MSFSFLNNLFQSLGENSDTTGQKDVKEVTVISSDKASSNQMDIEDDLQINKNEKKDYRNSKGNVKEAKYYLKVGDIFKHAYDRISTELDKNRGLNVVCKLAADQDKVNHKIKGKSFLLRKNAVLRGNKHLKAKKQTVSRKIIREKQLYDVKQITFEQASILNKLWEEYIVRILPQERAGSKPSDQGRFLPLLRADYHGAYIKIIGSKNHSEEGAEGIVVKETLKIFHVCYPDGNIKMHLKENIVFCLRIGSDWFKILGMNIILRSDDRSKFKPKWKNPLPRLEGVLKIMPKSR